VFLSSHLMSEMAQTADHLIVIGRGKVIADAPIHDIISGQGRSRVRVRTDEPERLHQLLAARGATIEVPDRELLEVTGLEPRAIAAAALEHQVMVYELTPLVASLEDAYMELTKNDVEYHSLPAAEVSK